MDTLLHTPDGVRDIYGNECAAKDRIEQNIMREFRLFGYDRIETPGFEFFDVFHRSEESASSREMYKFFDRDNNTLVLRPDITPAIARCVAKYFGEETRPLRFCYLGDVFRNHKNYKGTLSESTQSGVELVGDASVDADVEMLLLTIESLKAAGLREFQVEIGEVDFYRGLVEESGLSREQDLELRNLIENKNSFGVEEFVENTVKDPVTKAAFSRLTELFGSIEMISAAKQLTDNRKALEAIDRLEKISTILDAYGCSDYVGYDLGMLSGQDYYTGMIFKAYSYGTGDYIVTGGRYDNLLKQFGKDAPAVGFGININTLQNAMRGQKIEIPGTETEALVVYRKRATAKAAAMIAGMRREGKRVVSELYRPEITEEEYRNYAERLGAKQFLMISGDGE